MRLRCGEHDANALLVAVPPRRCVHFQKKTPRFGRGRYAEVETKVSDWESPFLTDENGNFLPVKARKQWTLDPSTNEWVEAVAEGSEEEGIEVVLGDDAQ